MTPWQSICCEVIQSVLVMLGDPMAVNMLYEVSQSVFVMLFDPTTMLRDPVVVNILYEVIQSLLVMLRDPLEVNMCRFPNGR